MKNGTNGLTNGAVCLPSPPLGLSLALLRIRRPLITHHLLTQASVHPPPKKHPTRPIPAAPVGGGASSVRLEDEPSNARSLGDAKASASNPAMPTTAPPAVPMSYDELKAKLAEAQATIASYAQEGGVRMRKVAKGETSNETVNQIAQRVQTNQGVPLQVVAALCLLSFLLAYLFF